MSEHGRLRPGTPSAPVGRCAVQGCLVCAAEAERQLLTVAEWVAEHLRPPLGPSRRQPVPATRGWPYSSWWEECGAV